MKKPSGATHRQVVVTRLATSKHELSSTTPYGILNTGISIIQGTSSDVRMLFPTPLERVTGASEVGASPLRKAMETHNEQEYALPPGVSLGSPSIDRIRTASTEERLLGPSRQTQLELALNRLRVKCE